MASVVLAIIKVIEEAVVLVDDLLEVLRELLSRYLFFHPFWRALRDQALLVVGTVLRHSDVGDGETQDQELKDKKNRLISSVHHQHIQYARSATRELPSFKPATRHSMCMQVCRSGELGSSRVVPMTSQASEKVYGSEVRLRMSVRSTAAFVRLRALAEGS